MTIEQRLAFADTPNKAYTLVRELLQEYQDGVRYDVVAPQPTRVPKDFDFTHLNIRQVVEIMARINQEHGFEKSYPDALEAVHRSLLLVVGEVCEAQEEVRSGHAPDEIYAGEGGKPEGFPIEIADTVIRLFNLCAQLRIDLQHALEMKAKYNDIRPFKHGRQF